MLKIQKRDGRVVEFDAAKITEAIFKAAKAVGGEDRKIAAQLTEVILDDLNKRAFDGHIPHVEEIQDTVERMLIENGHARTAKAYILYRDQRTRLREAKSSLMEAVSEILIETSRENANISNSPSAKMLQIASAASKRYYLSNLIPEEFAEAHLRGDVHIHDLDYYSKTLNCLQIDLEDLLTRGFDTGYGFIKPPKRMIAATAQAAIILQSNQNDMFGGQSFPHFDKSMANIIRRMPKPPVEDTENLSNDEIFQAMEALVHNLNSMSSRAGAQVPFSSINLGTDTTPEGRAVTRAMLLAFERGLGRGESPIFPNLVFRLKSGVNFLPGDPNYDLFRLALRVASKRMNPTFSFMDASFNQAHGDEVAYMGCRSRVIGNRHGAEVAAGRGNIAPISMNLPRVALKTRDLDLFWVELDRMMNLCVRQLIHRFEVIAALKVRDLPFLMGQKLYMGSEQLGPNDTIREAIKHGTLAIGFIGLAETLVALTGHHHGEDPKAQELGLKIVERMRKRCDEYSDYYDLNIVLYATPAEGTAGRYAPLDRKEFGIVPGVTDREYYTNSFHVPVGFEIAMGEKIALEGPYHRFCNAGHISYVELESPPQHNEQALEAILRQMAACDIGYAGINFPIDTCQGCGHTGVIHDDECPICGSTAIRRIRRITGYLSTMDRFNDAKKAELRDRKVHRFGNH